MSSLRIDSESQSTASGSVSGRSEGSSQVLVDFFSGTGLYNGSELLRPDRRTAKLAVWQAILEVVGLCESTEAGKKAKKSRPSHFPSPAPALPTSLTACRKLIQRYVFLNIVNFKANQMGKEKLFIFPR